MTMPQDLPGCIDPHRLASAGGVIEGTVGLASLSRLRDYLLADEAQDRGEVHAQLSFSRDAQRRLLITGRLQAKLTLQCQRCLQSLDWPVDASLQVQVVEDETAAANVPREHAPVIVGQDGLNVRGLIEDELILALPVVARCDDTHCPRRQAIDTDETHSGRTNPFAVLQQLKDHRQDN